MRKLTCFALALLLLPLSLAAQRFEGTLKVRVGGPGGTGAMLMSVTVKGDKVLNVMALPGMNREVRSITDNKARTMTSYTPFPPGMVVPSGVAKAKGVIAVQKLSALAPAPKQAGKSDLRPLGTSQTIAGYKCDDFELTGETGDVVRMCLSTSLGGVMMESVGPTPDGKPAPWARALGNKPVTPLKMWSSNGNTILEVVAIKRELVSSHAFDAPAGYIDMATALKYRTTVPKKP